MNNRGGQSLIKNQQRQEQPLLGVNPGQFAKDTQALTQNPLGLKMHVPLGGHYEYWYPFIRIGLVSMVLRVLAIVLVVLFGGMYIVHGATASFGKYGTHLYLSLSILAAMGTIITNHHGESLTIAKYRWFYIPFVLFGMGFMVIPSAVMNSLYFSKIVQDFGQCGAIRADPSTWALITTIVAAFGQYSPAMCLPENFGLLLVNFLITCLMLLVHFVMLIVASFKIILMAQMYITLDNDNSDPDAEVVRKLIKPNKSVTFADVLNPNAQFN